MTKPEDRSDDGAENRVAITSLMLAPPKRRIRGPSPAAPTPNPTIAPPRIGFSGDPYRDCRRGRPCRCGADRERRGKGAARRPAAMNCGIVALRAATPNRLIPTSAMAGPERGPGVPARRPDRAPRSRRRRRRMSPRRTGPAPAMRVRSGRGGRGRAKKAHALLLAALRRFRQCRRLAPADARLSRPFASCLSSSPSQASRAPSWRLARNIRAGRTSRADSRRRRTWRASSPRRPRRRNRADRPSA